MHITTNKNYVPPPRIEKRFLLYCSIVPFLSCTVASPTDEWELALRDRCDREPERDRERSDAFSGVADRDLECCRGDLTGLLDLLDLGLSLGDLDVADVGLPCTDILKSKCI